MDPCAPRRLVLRSRSRAVALSSWFHSHQIDHGEQPNPDDVERVPKKSEAEKPAFDGRAQPLDRDLDHHHDEPDQAERDVQPMATYKREEGGKKRAALRVGADCDHVIEFAQLQGEERRAQCERQQSVQVGGADAPRTDRQRHQPARVARREQAGCFDRDTRLIEDLGARQAARGRPRQHRVGCKQRGEHHDVAQQEDPEAVGDDDPLGGVAGFACHCRGGLVDLMIDGNQDVHAAISACCSASKRAILSAGISISSSSRKAKSSMATKMPSVPSAAIHQICQISAKPETTAKNAITKPIGLFFGISIAAYSPARASRLRRADGCCFSFQNSSTSVTGGSTAKFHAGGGEAVAHSRVRPFHGSAGALSFSRLRIETTSWITWQTMPARMTTTPKAATISQGCQLATS